MDAVTKEQYRRLFEKYKDARKVKYGSPDQFQWRKNELLECMAELFLQPYFNLLDEEDQKRNKDMNLE